LGEEGGQPIRVAGQRREKKRRGRGENAVDLAVKGSLEKKKKGNRGEARGISSPFKEKGKEEGEGGVRAS